MNPTTAKRLAVLLLLALGLRLGAAWFWQTRIEGRFGFGDSQTYWELGRTIARGEAYQFGDPPARVFRTPGYPVLLAPLFLLCGDEPPVGWARAENALLGALTVAAVWWLAAGLFDARSAWIAAMLTAVYPGAIVVSGLVLSEAPFCLLMVVQLALWTMAWRATTRRVTCGLALGAGLVAAAATLVRPSWLLFTPLAALLGVAVGGSSPCAVPGQQENPGLPQPGLVGRKKQFVVAAMMVLGLAATMSPWWIRNATVTGQFVPTTLQVGASLYDGLHPGATGASDMAFVPEFTDRVRHEPAVAGESFEVRLDRRFRQDSLAFVRQNPAAVARLAGVKFCRMWNVWPNEPSLSTWPVRVVVAASFLPVLLLGVLGAMRTIHRDRPYWLCWLPAVYFSGLHVIFVSSIRYRQPAMLGLIVLAAGMAGGWLPAAGSSGRNGGQTRPLTPNP